MRVQPMKVVILVLNEGLWIRGAVESVTAGASDVIVDDGGSSDGSRLRLAHG